LEIQELKEIVKDNYSLCIKNIEKIKNVYKIETENRILLLENY